MLGICNGFQALTHLGVFDEELKGKVALTHNQSGRFMNRWVSLNVVGKSPYVKSIAKMELPIRHGEGRLVFENESIAASAFESGKCVMQYSENVNGAWNEIAALAVNEGRVMGMMPHPEAFWCNELHPTGNVSKGPLGTEIFKNAFECFK